jgi:acetyltransferase-like isoleucine patch superfamily enzyme
MVLFAWIEKALSTSELVFVGMGQLLSLIPGVIGVYLRGAYYFGTLRTCSWETHIGFGSVFMHREARVGRNVSTGSFCIFGHVRIGHDARFASRISVPSGRRQHVDDQGRLSPETRFDQVTIGNGSWVGEGAIIMGDIGPESIVSAGSVVIKAMPEASLIGGNPARVLKAL